MDEHFAERDALRQKVKDLTLLLQNVAEALEGKKGRVLEKSVSDAVESIRKAIGRT